MSRNGPRIVTGGLCPEIQIQADIGGINIVLGETTTDLSAQDLDCRLDLYTKAINRKRAQVDLGLALADLANQRFELEDLPRVQRAYEKGRGEEHARLRASFEAAHDGAGRRGEFKMNESQKNRLQDILSEIDKKKGEFANRTAMLRDVEIPGTEKRIERCRKQIAGEADRHEVLEAAD